MMAVTKKLLIFILAPLVLIVLLLIIIGGGFGAKEELPTVISGADRPLLFAHRGVTTNFPENSQGAVVEAISKRFPAVELDVQFSADSFFFAHHDKKIYYANNTYLTADVLKVSDVSIPVDHNPVLVNKKTRVPKLLSLTVPFKYQLIFYFDMKRYGHDSVFDLAHDIAAFIKGHNLQQTTMVASAHVVFISYLEFTNPEIITVLEGIDTEHPWLYNLIPTKFRSDLIASRQATINDDFIQWLKDNNMLSRYIVYHGDESNFQSTLDMGIEMFIVDYKPYLDSYLYPDKSILYNEK